MLIEAGHHATTPFEAGIAGVDDLLHFEYARQHQLTILTRDPDDFEELHRQYERHYGIIAICEEADRRKNMSYADIVRAINNLASANVSLIDQFYVLNHWRW
jgi:hypothetical protein